MRVFLFAMMITSVAGHCAATAQDAACEAPRYLLHMSRAAGGLTGADSLVIDGTAARTYEGSPIEWSHYAVTALPCESDDLPDFAEGGDVVAGVFKGRVPVEADSSDVPDNCADPIYLLGVNTVTDAEQYAIYIDALSGSRIAPRHGFVRLFGGTPDPLLAGTWPDNTTATLSIWPCAEAFHTMHTSDEFQSDIKPLRNNAANYRLMTFRPAE